MDASLVIQDSGPEYGLSAGLDLHAHANNYREVFVKNPFFTFTLNSLIVAAGSTGLALVLGSCREHATEYAMGKLGEIVPDGVCRLLPAKAYVAWDIHLFPGGIGANLQTEVLEDNVVELGLWLHPRDYQYEYRQDLRLYGIRQGELLLKPHGTSMTQGFLTFDHPVRLDSFQPHGHLRLRSASLEIMYPGTGRIEVISMVSNWSALWHQSHIYEEHVAPLVPKGGVIIMKQWYDNTENNPNVVDPDLWVDYGNRTSDEMMNHSDTRPNVEPVLSEPTTLLSDAPPMTPMLNPNRDQRVHCRVGAGLSPDAPHGPVRD